MVLILRGVVNETAVEEPYVKGEEGLEGTEVFGDVIMSVPPGVKRTAPSGMEENLPKEGAVLGGEYGVTVKYIFK